MKKKGILKRLCTLSLMAVLVLCLLPMGASAADTNVASLTNGETVTYYATADKAFEAAAAAGSGTVTILANAEVNTESVFSTEPDIHLVVNSGATLTLNARLMLVCTGQVMFPAPEPLPEHKMDI